MTVRGLAVSDEPAFVRLLRAVYDDTYSYRDLYAPGGFARLLATGRVLAFGDFDSEGELFSHTAFLLKDPRGDYVESGMSLRDARRRGEGRTDDAEVWSALLAIARGHGVYVHQNTTTTHPLAQRYAERYMSARPTGLIAEYTVGEQLVGLVDEPTSMQALTMTSVVRPERDHLGRVAMIPEGPWADWLAARFEGWGHRVTAIEHDAGAAPIGLEPIEDNPWIGLRRRCVIAEGAEPLAAALARGRARTDLVHVPADERASSLPALLAADYVPVGVRPHASRPDEIIVQHLPADRRARVVAALRSARVHGDEARQMIEGWVTRCARAS